MSSFQGRESEYLFASRASKHGLVVGFPSMEAVPYDFFICNGKQTYRIQVKSTLKATDGSYKLDMRTTREGKRVGYTASCCDFVAAVLLDTGIVYIIPQDECPEIHLKIVPGGKYHKYREAWQLLKS